MQNITSEIAKIFNNCGIHLKSAELSAFSYFYEMLEKYNDEYDLSRIKKFDDMIIKHFVDSIFPIDYYQLKSPLIDIGTGAGFPGLPIKILKPDLEIILAEPKKSRVVFMEKIITGLNLKNVTVYPHIVNNKTDLKVNSVITRAFSSIDQTLDIVRDFLPVGGLVNFMKGPQADKDSSQMSDINKSCFSLINQKEYCLPTTHHSRSLLVYKKEKGSVIKYYNIQKNLENKAVVIESSSNEKYKLLKKIAANNKKTGKTIVSGIKIIRDLYKSLPDKCGEIIIFDNFKSNDDAFNDIVADFEKRNNVIILKKGLFNELDTSNNDMPLMTVDVPEIPLLDKNCLRSRFLMIPFQDPANVGSVIRSALAFGINDIILLEECANPYHSKSVRSSGGAVFCMNFFKGPSINDLELLQKNIEIISIDKSGKNLKDFNFPEHFILLPGLEGQGLPEHLKKQSVSIKIDGRVESLNASVAVSIILHHLADKV